MRKLSKGPIEDYDTYFQHGNDSQEPKHLKQKDYLRGSSTDVRSGKDRISMEAVYLRLSRRVGWMASVIMAGPNLRHNGTACRFSRSLAGRHDQ